jgi:TRAP transporter 4TM/12TM fusion protein
LASSSQDNRGSDAASVGLQWCQDSLGFLMVAMPVAWVLDLPRQVGLLLNVEQFVAVVLGVAVVLAFLVYRIDGSRGRKPPLYDIALAAIGGTSCLYVAITFQSLATEYPYRPVLAITVALALVVPTLEALRRAVGWGLTLVVLLFFCYGLFGSHLGGWVQAPRTNAHTLITFIAFDSEAMLGRALVIAATVIACFMLFGQVFIAAGGGGFITDLASGLMKGRRGGAAKIAILASSLFGTISGSAVSNVMSTGTVTIPLMRSSGFSRPISAGIEAAASTGGQLMPPVMGAAAFLMAEFLAVPYRDIIVAALVPALLYYFALFVQADLLAARIPKEVNTSDIDVGIRTVLRRGLIFALPLVLLVVVQLQSPYTPEFGALVGLVATVGVGLLFGYRDKRLNLRILLRSIVETGRNLVDIVLVCAAAGVVIGIVNRTGLGFSLTLGLSSMSGDNLIPLLLLTAAICIVLGTGLPTSALYVLLAVLVAPALVDLGVEPLAAHLFVLYFGLMSMITPPIAFAALAAAKVAKSGFGSTAWAAMRFGWSAYILPFVFATTPALLLSGSWIEIVVAIVATMAGIWLISAGGAGYLNRQFGYRDRLFALAAGSLLVFPQHETIHGIALNLLGCVMAGFLLMPWDRIRATLRAPK